MQLNVVCTLIEHYMIITVVIWQIMWLSVVCTLIDNDTRHHSGQNVVDSRGAAAAEWVNNKFWPQWYVRVQASLNHIRLFVFTKISMQRQKKSLLQSASLKRHCVTPWLEQRCLDSYWQRQLHCKISSKSGKKIFRRFNEIFRNGFF